VQKETTALRVDVANAVRRLWKVDGDGRTPAWAPGASGFLGDCLSEDDELRQLIEGVANAGSYGRCVDGCLLEELDEAVGSLCAHLQTSAHRHCGKISTVITECRCAVAKVRHERAAKEGAERVGEAATRTTTTGGTCEYHHERDGRQMGSGGKQPLDQLLASGAAHQRCYVRRHKRVEDDRAKVAEAVARMKELRVRSRAGKERLARTSERAL
jgi:hypothetical protein